MKRRALSAAAIALASALAACVDSAPSPLQGYAEGEFVLIASNLAGTLEALDVARGQQVARGDPLFALDRSVENAALAESQARLQAAEMRLGNLLAARRTDEIAALRQQAAAARATLALAEQVLRQQERLHADGFVSQARLDEARAAHDRAAADAQVRSASQSIGRSKELAAAEAEVEAARAAVAQARARRGEKALVAPAAGTVADTYFHVGESVPAGAPVVSLLPPGNVKVRFFVPETDVGSLRLGQPVRVSCDGCGPAIPARISFVSPSAEYTPPVIFSRESRSKLVFLVEARPSAADAQRLHPGQPVDVLLGAP